MIAYRTRLTWPVLAMAMVPGMVISSCGQSEPGGPPQAIAVHGQERFPLATLSDLVSFAHQISLVTVLDEYRVPAPPGSDPKHEGYVARRVTVRIDHNLWTSPADETVGGTVEIGSIGWADTEEHGLVPFVGQLEVGKRYVLALTVIDGQWTNLSPSASMLVEQDRIAAETAVLPYEHPWMDEAAGNPIGTLEAQLNATQPSALAVHFAYLPPDQRAQAVIVAESQGLATAERMWPHK